jgi:hypothetical protein
MPLFLFVFSCHTEGTASTLPNQKQETHSELTPSC